MRSFFLFLFATFLNLLEVCSISLPWPVSTTYNSIDLKASVDFMVNMIGAEEVPVNMTISSNCDATMRWVRMPGSGYEFHFISSPSLSTANFSFADYVSYVEGIYGNISETTAHTYNQFMDHHIGMITEDMTPYYTTLVDNRVPFFMVGQYPAFFDLFVEIPATGYILEVTSQRLDEEDVPISEWDICQGSNGTPNATAPGSKETAGRGRRFWASGRPGISGAASAARVERGQPARSGPVKGRSARGFFPQLNWRKTTYAAPHPADAEAISITLLGSAHVVQGHPGVWAKRCAKIAWTEFDYAGPAGIPYQFHFVDGYLYPPFPPAMDIISFAQWQEQNRDFEHDKWDEWANNRLSMWVGDLEPYLAKLEAWEPLSPLFFKPTFVARRAGLPGEEKKEEGERGGGSAISEVVYSVVVDLTPIFGHVLELKSDRYPYGNASYPNPAPWSFCP